MDFLEKVTKTIEYLSDNGLHNYLNYYDRKHNVELSFYEWIELMKDKQGLVIEKGATKLVVVFTDEDWVIKIPLTYLNEYIDYCKVEFNNFNAAVTENLEFYFAPMKYIGEICSIPVYIQEKAEINRELFEDSFYDYSKDHCEPKEYYKDEDDYYDAIYDYVDDMDDTERLEAIFGYIEELEDFVNENCINDLHSANFGTIDGRTVLVDYSGY